jgi:hypothetical protein
MGGFESGTESVLFDTGGAALPRELALYFVGGGSVGEGIVVAPIAGDRPSGLAGQGGGEPALRKEADWPIK